MKLMLIFCGKPHCFKNILLDNLISSLLVKNLTSREDNSVLLQLIKVNLYGKFAIYFSAVCHLPVIMR